MHMLFHCYMIYSRLEGMPYRSVPSPALPDFCVMQSQPFQNSGVDFAGPMYIKGAENPKVWLCLSTCCTTRAVHLEIVPDLNASTFLHCFRLFTSRCGVLNKMVSDNAKTFKAGSEALRKITSDQRVWQHFSKLNIKWEFNFEKAPWWGGFVERMVGSVKLVSRRHLVGPASPMMSWLPQLLKLNQYLTPNHSHTSMPMI